MKKYIISLFVLLVLAVPAVAWQPLVSGSTTGEVTFVLYNDAGDVVTGATVSSVIRRRGTGDDTAMTTPTVTEEGNGFYSLLVDEDTTITEGLVEEGMFFRVNMSSGEPVFVSARLMAAQATITDVAEEVRDTALAAPEAGAPSATPTLGEALAWIFTAWRNKVETTATSYTLYADDGTTPLVESTNSDDDTTYTKGELATP